jgi:O-antigen/teichoic acid export membrane protein
MYLATPLIITTLISGSAQYIDGVIISAIYKDPAYFVLFRYGAKEFPLVLMLANGLSIAMLSEFSTRERMKESLELIKVKSAKLMHLLFPVTIVTMLLAKWVFPFIFRAEFHRSAGIFLVYSLMIIPRLVFPQTILVGRKKTHITLIAAIIELSINIPLSLLLITEYKLVGVALASFLGYTANNLFMVIYVWVKMNIKPAEYIPLRIYAFYSVVISILFILIDRGIIRIY